MAILALMLVPVLVLPGVAAAATYEGRVVAVTDGQTLVILADNRRVDVRLAGIAAPTGTQRHAIGSRQALIAVCGGEPARFETQASIPRVGVVAAQVLCNGVDAAAEQVRRGMAQVSNDAGSGSPSLAALQADARAARRGIWSHVSAQRSRP